MLEGMKKEEDFKVQLQLLTASLAQKEEHIDALCRERTQKDVSYLQWGTDVSKCLSLRRALRCAIVFACLPLYFQAQATAAIKGMTDEKLAVLSQVAFFHLLANSLISRTVFLDSLAHRPPVRYFKRQQLEAAAA